MHGGSDKIGHIGVDISQKHTKTYGIKNKQNDLHIAIQNIQ